MNKRAALKSKIFKTLLLIVIIFSLVTCYQYFNDDMTALKQARSLTEMSFMQADQGNVRYQTFGDKNNPTVILIHSFNGFIESWLPNISTLVDAEYHVVAYDLYGRGLSDRPRVNYDLALFRKQLELVIETVKVENIHLVGASFGSVIAADFTTHYPKKVNSLTMVGPAGWPDAEGRSPLLDVPILGELVFHYFGRTILQPKVKDYFVDPNNHPEMIEKWLYFAEMPGFMRSALSTLRHAPVQDFSDGWKTLGALNIPTLFIWGKQDVSFPFAHSKKIPGLIPHAEIMGIDDAAHWVNVEQAAQVNQAIVSFLENSGINE